MTTIFFTSDTEFFNDVNHNRIIETWNDQVKPKDLIYFLGNFSYGTTNQNLEILSKLKGQVILLRGGAERRLKRAVLDKFSNVATMLTISEPYPMVLFHYPLVRWEGKDLGVWHLHGYSSIATGMDISWKRHHKLVSYKEVVEYHSLPYSSPHCPSCGNEFPLQQLYPSRTQSKHNIGGVGGLLSPPKN